MRRWDPRTRHALIGPLTFRQEALWAAHLYGLVAYYEKPTGLLTTRASTRDVAP